MEKAANNTLDWSCDSATGHLERDENAGRHSNRVGETDGHSSPALEPLARQDSSGRRERRDDRQVLQGVEDDCRLAGQAREAIQPQSEIVRPSPGVYPGMSSELYHSVRAVSSSALKAFILKCPLKAKAVIEGRVREETATMKKGTALHAAVLEPDSFNQVYRIGPEVRRNSNEWKDFAKQCEAEGVEPLKPSENEDIIGMRDSLWSEPGVAKILRACESRELSIFWNDPDTGLYCKARLDIYGERIAALLDLKGTGNAKPEDFERTAHNQGYHIQIPWYTRGARAVGLAVKMSGILAVEFEADYTPCIFQVSPSLFTRGMTEIQNALPALAECQSTGQWPGYMPDGRPVELNAPRWADKQGDFDE